MTADQSAMRFIHKTTAGIKGVNQDALAVPADEHDQTTYGVCLAVADGITLCPKGGELAEAAIKIVDFYYEIASKRGPGPVSLDAALQKIWNEFFNRVLSNDDQDYLISGTTLTCVLIHNQQLHLRHLGDSHCDIFLPDGQCKRLTVDQCSPEGALLNYFGGELQTSCQEECVDFPDGSKVILSSDGISYFIDCETMLRLAEEYQWDAELMAKIMFNIADQIGSTDDKTLIIGY